MVRTINGTLVTSGDDLFRLANVQGPGRGAFVTSSYIGNGNYTLIFDFMLVGDYMYELHLNGEILGALRTVTIFAGPANSAASVLLDALPAARVGAQFVVRVEPRDFYGNRASVSPSISMYAEMKNNAGNSSLVSVAYGANVIDVSVVPSLGGPFTLSILMYGAAIADSPFILFVDPNCLPGTFAPDATTSVCSACPPNTFSETARARTCELCDANAQSDAGSAFARNCTCRVGFFMPLDVRSDRSRVPVCQACVAGALCAGGDSGPVALPGWMPAQGSADTFVRCPNVAACAGNGRCTRGYTGALCTLCAKNYYKLGDTCYRCNNGLVGFVIAVGILLMFGFALALVLLNSKRYRSFGMASFIVAINSLQIIALYGNIGLAWPEFARNFFNVVSLINLNLDLTAPECSFAVENPWLLKWALTLMLPLFFVLVLGALFGLGVPLLRLMPQLGLGASVGEFRAAVVRSGYHVLAMLYLPLASSTMRFWQCAEVQPGVYVMAAQQSQRCYVASYWRTVPVVLLFMLLYLVGIPAGLLVVLRRHMQAHGVIALWLKFGFLVHRYREQAYLFEIAILLRKLGVCSVVVFRAASVQASMIALALVAALAHTAAVLPYQSKSHSLLDVFSLVCCLTVIIGGNMSDATMRNVLVIPGLLLNVLGMCAGIAYDVFVLRKAECREERAFDKANANRCVSDVTVDDESTRRRFTTEEIALSGPAGVRKVTRVSDRSLDHSDELSVLGASDAGTSLVPLPPPFPPLAEAPL